MLAKERVQQEMLLKISRYTKFTSTLKVQLGGGGIRPKHIYQNNIQYPLSKIIQIIRFTRV